MSVWPAPSITSSRQAIAARSIDSRDSVLVQPPASASSSCRSASRRIRGRIPRFGCSLIRATSYTNREHWIVHDLASAQLAQPPTCRMTVAARLAVEQPTRDTVFASPTAEVVLRPAANHVEIMVLAQCPLERHLAKLETRPGAVVASR